MPAAPPPAWDAGREPPTAIIGAVTPLLLGAAGLLAFVAGGMVLRTFGPQYRIGRLLATTPRVSVAEANRLAAAGRRTYVRVDGRIDATDEFEDADHRPLVLRRVRLEARVGRDWRPFEDHRQVVPFAINEGLDSIAVDIDALADGLVVVPRESVGRAADLPDRVPERYGPDTTVRARIEQVSSVEHATVLGYPVPAPIAPSALAAPAATSAAAEPIAADHRPTPAARLTSGRGRPLILTVLEADEAMRILAGGDAGRTRFAAALLGAGAILVAGALAWTLVAALLPAVIAVVPGAAGLVESVLAASPEPSVSGGGDPRSDGQGPGLIGTPGLAIIGVVAIGLISVLITTVYVRLTRPAAPRSSSGSPHARR